MSASSAAGTNGRRRSPSTTTAETTATAQATAPETETAARQERESGQFRVRRARARVAFDLGEHLVVVGCGPVAARLVDDLLPWVREGHLRLTVLGAEMQPAYNRVLVGEYAVGRINRTALDVADLQTWRSAGVEVRVGARVLSVDRSTRMVRFTERCPAVTSTETGTATSTGTDSGTTSGTTAGTDPGTRVATTGQIAFEELSWDRLVLATGARPVRPNMRGIDPSPDGAPLPPGVIALRDLADAHQMQAVIRDGGNVVILGGGVLGVEAALAAAETTGAATLVHTGQAPMERVLSEATAHLLTKRLAAAGVTCVSARAQGIRLDTTGRFQALDLADRPPLAGDLLVISCGVNPRTGLAESSGLKTLHGIVVDHELQADVEGRVFAIGDCAEVLCKDPGCEPCLQRSSGAWARVPGGMIAPGWRQAEYLAARIGAELTNLVHPTMPTVPVEPMPAHEPSVLRLKARDIDLVVLESGVQPRNRVARTVRFTDDALVQDLHAELEADGRLRRAVVLGRPRAVAHLSGVLESDEPMRGDLTYLLSLDSTWAAPEPAATGPDTVVCRCAGVTRGELETTIHDGATCVAEITAATRACTGCGTCRPEIQALLAERAHRV